ncbi:MAG: hypothetical protein WBD20_21335 [Pirellulaceae bacterium]
MSKETNQQSKSESTSSKSGAQSSKPLPERRQRNGGISAGGRRKADRAVVAPMSNSSRIWFGLSLILTLVIMIWTFSVPFRSKKPIFAWEKSDLPVRAVPVSREILDDPEHAMTNEQYKAHIWMIEEDLQKQVKERNRIPDNLPDAKVSQEVGERKVANMKSELEELAKLEAKLKEGFDEKSIQFQAMKNLQNKLKESDDLFPGK